MPVFQINDDERSALAGLPHLSRLIYVFGLRPYMNFATGIVGAPPRGVSWKSLAEELHVEPHPGIAGGDPSEKELRRALVWLQKGGLLSDNMAERKLVFRLLLADSDWSVSKKVGSKRADEAGREVGIKLAVVKPFSGAGCGQPQELEAGRELAGEVPLEAGTPPVSANHTVPLAREADGVPESAGQWAQFFIRQRRFQLHVVQTPKTMPLFAQWAERGITTHQMLTAMEAAEVKLGAVPDTPLYYRNFLEQLLLETQRLAEQELRDERAHRSNTPGFGRQSREPGSLTAELHDTTWAENLNIPAD